MGATEVGRSGKKGPGMRRLGSPSVGIVVLVLGLLVSMGRSVGAQDATPAACPTTTEEENAALVSDLFAAVAAGEDVTRFYPAQHIVHTAAGEDLPNTAPSWFMDRMAAYPDRSVTLEQVVAQDDRVAVYAMWTGTQLEDDETRDLPATGRQAEWAQTVFYRIECGTIVEVWPVTDTFGLLTDLGFITDEEVQSVESLATPAP
jgi:predicted ester cyclase